jgi:hypothetical protein
MSLSKYNLAQAGKGIYEVIICKIVNGKCATPGALLVIH